MSAKDKDAKTLLEVQAAAEREARVELASATPMDLELFGKIVSSEKNGARESRRYEN
jgi:hypothetical protein